MSVPKQRHTKQRRDRKRERFAIEPVKTQTCAKCGSQKMPHRVCANCGTYKGREVVNALKKIEKKK
ncbi:MAG TPA: 50S ribosomal protein L32 [Candidatus Moranbacteria bacterium]|nr:50S ribosomal protein L32 [Candidatus Moranbacteria bacterium]